MEVLVLDDWAWAPLQEAERRDVLEVLEDRSGTGSTIVTSQLPPGQWHDYVEHPTLADAICDRLLHNAHRIVPKGPSRRKEGKLEELAAAAQRRSAPIMIPDRADHDEAIAVITIAEMRIRSPDGAEMEGFGQRRAAHRERVPVGVLQVEAAGVR